LKDGEMHGQGKMTYTKDSVATLYHGMWKHGKRDGQGYYIIKGGKIVKVKFKDGDLIDGPELSGDGSKWTGDDAEDFKNLIIQGII